MPIFLKKIPARIAIAEPPSKIEIYGVPNFLLIKSSCRGRTLSLPITKLALVPPIIELRTTEPVATMAENDMRSRKILLFEMLDANVDKGDGLFPIVFQSSMPTSTMAIAMYSTKLTKNASSNALGIVFCGFFVSSDIMATVLNPRNAKKIIAEPFSIPPKPFGKNG